MDHDATVIVDSIETSMGAFGAVLTPKGLALLTFPREPRAVCEAWVQRWVPSARVVHGGPMVDRVSEQVNAYLEGSLRQFSVPLDLHGTPFQVRVWRAVYEIPYGETRTYGGVAREIGRPKAVRAVGAANGANPVPIIVPCHRVIGSKGTLTGYGGGLDLKEWLLRLEGVMAAPNEPVQRELALPA